MIQQAQSGLYSQQRISVLPKWAIIFNRVGLGQYQVHPDIHNRCHFIRMNLFDQNWVVPSDVSLTLCKRLYYFSENNQRELVERIWHQTAENGFWSPVIQRHLEIWGHLGP